MKHSKQSVIVASALLLIAAQTVALAGNALANSPATFTTNSDGSAVNANHYATKCDPYLNGGPVNAVLPDGSYVFFVLAPSGQADPNGSDLLSTDANANRTFSLSGGNVVYNGTHPTSTDTVTGATLIDLCDPAYPAQGYNDTPNPGGVYILAICPEANQTPSACKYDMFKVPLSNTPPGPSAPVVTKDAAGTYDCTTPWNITKDVDKTEVDQSGTSTDFTYTVTVSHDACTVSNPEVAGTIDVFNPNGDSITGVTISDQLSDGTVCTVTGGTNATLLPGDNYYAYTCSLSALPQGELDNMATASWATQTLSNGSLAGDSTSFTFSNISFTENLIDECVSVSDPADVKSPRVFCVGDPGDPTFSFQYTHTVTGTAGTCTTFDNTATFTTNDTGSTGSASQSVKLCVGANLTVSKGATPSFNRRYLWNVTKSVDKTTVSKSSGSATFNYTVVVNQTGVTDSGWQVMGPITVTNPNDWESVTFDLADAINNGGNCTIDGGGTGLTVAASSSVHATYTCTYAAKPNPAAFTNTATATWDASAASTPDGTATGTATGAFGAPTSTTDKVITPTDTFNGGPATNLCVLDPTVPCTLTGVDSAPFTTRTYHYSRTISVPASGCLSYTNTAATGTGPTSSKTVQVCKLNSGGFTIGYWQNNNGQAYIQAHAAALCTYLTPFGNILTGLPNCAGANIAGNSTKSGSLAKYVYDTIKAANSAGDGVLMLKAQFLATAINVFQTPSLGTTNIVLSSSQQSILGLGACSSVNSILTAENSQFPSYSSNKSKVVDLQTLDNAINNDAALTC